MGFIGLKSRSQHVCVPSRGSRAECVSSPFSARDHLYSVVAPSNLKASNGQKSLFYTELL